MEQNKIYSILMLCNYEKSSTTSSKWIVAVKSIRNNLLGTAYTKNCGWIKYSNLPKIDTSLVDIVESIDEAKEYLDNSTPDVIIVEDKIGNAPIGTGTLDVLREKAPNAIFIILLDGFQKKGATRTTKTGEQLVSQGKKVESLYQGGYYNAIFKNQLDMTEICNMIISGGYSAEWAFSNYGLGNEDPVDKTQNVPEVSSSEEGPQEDAPEASNDVSENEVSEKTPETSEIIEDTAVTGDIITENKDEEKYNIDETVSSETENDIAETEAATEVSIPVLKENTEASKTAEAKEATVLEAPTEEQNAHMNLPIGTMEFPTISNSIDTKVNYCHSKVSFVQNDTIILKAIQSLAKSNLDAAKLIHYPVAVPYIKKDNTANNDMVYYCMTDLSFVQDDTIVLRSEKPLSELQIGLDTLESSPVAIPYINGERDLNKNLNYLFAKVTFVQDDILVLHSKQSLSKKGLNMNNLGKLPVRIPYMIEKNNKKGIILTSGIIQFVLDDTIIVKLNKGVPVYENQHIDLANYLVAIPYIISK